MKNLVCDLIESKQNFTFLSVICPLKSKYMKYSQFEDFIGLDSSLVKFMFFLASGSKILKREPGLLLLEKTIEVLSLCDERISSGPSKTNLVLLSE